MYEEIHEGQASEMVSINKQIFNELSSILSHFNQILISMHKSCQHSIQTQESLMLQNLSFVSKMSQKALDFINLPSAWINSDSISQHAKQPPPQDRTYNRFVSRLAQSISSFKQKIANSQGMNILFLTIKEMQKILTKFTEVSSLSKTLKSIYNILLEFCNDLKDKKTKQTIKDEKTQDKKNLKKHNIETDAEKKKKITLYSLNQSFQSMKCLDLDYSHFRFSYFDAQHNQLYHQYLERNKNIKSTVELYSKTFKQHLMNKEKKKTEKKRSNIFKRSTERQTSGRKEGIMFHKRYMKKKIIEHEKQKIKENKDVSLQEDVNKQNCQSERRLKSEKLKSQKMVYKMKNIILNEPNEQFNTQNIYALKKNIFQFEYNGKKKQLPATMFSMTRNLIRNIKK